MFSGSWKIVNSGLLALFTAAILTLEQCGPCGGLNPALAGLMWVCGKTAFHTLPAKWRGCCYSAFVTTGSVIHTALPISPNGGTVNDGNDAGLQRARRELPGWYKGYKIGNPWTAPGPTIRWSLFLGGGTAAALNKICNVIESNV